MHGINKSTMSFVKIARHCSPCIVVTETIARKVSQHSTHLYTDDKVGGGGGDGLPLYGLCTYVPLGRVWVLSILDLPGTNDFGNDHRLSVEPSEKQSSLEPRKQSISSTHICSGPGS